MKFPMFALCSLLLSFAPAASEPLAEANALMFYQACLQPAYAFDPPDFTFPFLGAHGERLAPAVAARLARNGQGTVTGWYLSPNLPTLSNPVVVVYARSEPDGASIGGCSIVFPPNMAGDQFFAALVHYLTPNLYELDLSNQADGMTWHMSYVAPGTGDPVGFRIWIDLQLDYDAPFVATSERLIGLH